MREIKFRAWDNIAGRFKTGTELAETIIRVELDGAIELKGAIYNISEVTLMQYTGLKDKNGVEIYEGDILCRYSRGEHIPDVRPVVWNQQAAQFRFDDLANPINYFQSIEVIGNIYENPELLEAK